MNPSVLSALVWSALGFGLGWLSCRIAMKTGTTEAKRSGNVSRRRIAYEVTQSLVGVLILVMVVVSGVQYYRNTSCQRAYNEVVAQSLSARSEAQRVEAQAQVELLTATLSGDNAALARETREYIAAIQELESVRSSSPLPESPNCGGR